MASTKVKPWNTEIWTDSIATLRAMDPQVVGHTVDVAGYYFGSKKGGGKFVYDADDTTTADDGGFTIVTASGKRFKRADPMSTLDITHFGAYCNGLADDMFAVVRMHNWARTVDSTFNMGVMLPSGITTLSNYDFGTAEMPAFKLQGPTVAYGRIPSARIQPFNMAYTGYLFRFKARRMNVANIAIIGTGSQCGFMENTVTRGDYCMLEKIQARSLKGRCFHVYDTIDCTVRQCYSSQGAASFFRTDWSNENPGAWDHPTAIKIAECNMEGHTGEFAISCIRAGQSVMEDTWFDHCNQGFDISQGGWLLKNVTQENSTLPSGTQYTKLTRIKCRFAQGAGVSDTVSGYDPAQDPSGSMPSWVNSVYERGTAEWDALGFKNTGSFSYGYESSQYKMYNMSADAIWYEVCTLGLTGQTGRSVIIEMTGTGHFDSATDSPRPGSTNYGGGKATIHVQQKDGSNKAQASWFGEGACPLRQVRIDNSNGNRPRIFVQLISYTGAVGVHFKTSDRSNFEGGLHFYLSPTFTIVDASAVPATVVPPVWNVGNNSAGMGFNMTEGVLAIDGLAPSAFAAQFVPVDFNGVRKYMPLQDTQGPSRLQRYSFAEMPSPATVNAWSYCICTDSGTGTGAGTTAQLVFSDGSYWIRAHDNGRLVYG